MEAIYELLRQEIAEAQAHQEEYKNRHRTPAPNYRVGDMVYLSARNISTERPSKKLDWKRIRPYPIKEIISPCAYKLDLPPLIKVYPVFYVNLLELAADDPIPGHY
jgi:hypothetical protein